MHGTLEPPPLDAKNDSVLLDFDGTLVDFAPRPDAIVLRPGTRKLLGRLSEHHGGALALVSGRRIADLDGFLAPLKIAAIGVHGQETRRFGGEVAIRAPSPDLGVARQRLQKSLSADDPLLMEDKATALVLHYRTCPEERERALRLAAAAVDGLQDLAVVEGHAIAEIRQRNVSKADAVTVVAEWPEFSGRKPIFIGDDTTDEDGFDAATAAGGFGVKVGDGQTSARFRLPDVAAVHEWLSMSASRQELGV